MATIYYVHTGPRSDNPAGKQISLNRIIKEFPYAKPCWSKTFPEINGEDRFRLEDIVIIEICEDEITQPDYRKAGFYAFPHSHMSHDEAEKKLFSNH